MKLTYYKVKFSDSFLQTEYQVKSTHKENVHNIVDLLELIRENGGTSIISVYGNNKIHVSMFDVRRDNVDSD